VGKNKYIILENLINSKYEVNLYWSDDDGVYIAEAPELAGCVAYGATDAEALVNVREAITLWLDTAREFGDPIPLPNVRKLLYS
jgi:predicted RNase H-like HicB family nuclease